MNKQPLQHHIYVGFTSTCMNTIQRYNSIATSVVALQGWHNAVIHVLPGWEHLPEGKEIKNALDRASLGNEVIYHE